MSEAPTSGVEAEGRGETVGEAKWAALRELERLAPGLDRASVEFVVVSEGERGLLGVGFVEARVIARADAQPGSAVAPAPAPVVAPSGDDRADSLAEVLARICHAIGVEAHVRVRASADGYEAVLEGDDLALLIGKHGSTIDALQYLATAVLARRHGERVEVSVDAAGYRARRRRSLEAIADRAAEQALSTGSPVELDPMSSSERKVVHLRLRDRADVETTSSGDEPARFVVVRLAPSP